MPFALGSRTSIATVAPAPALVGRRVPLAGRTLIVVRVLWTLIAVGTLALVVTGTPIRYELVRTSAQILRAPEFRDLIGAGVRPEIAAAGDVAVGLLLFAGTFAGGVVLFARGSTSREVALLSMTLLLWGAGFSGLTSVHRTPGPPFSQAFAGIVATVQFFLTTATGYFTLFWLPHGRFPSRWAGLLALSLSLAVAGLYFFVSFPRAHDLVNLVGLPGVAVGIASQIYQYRQVADPVMRQQIKWGVIGIVLTALGFFVWQTATLLVGQQPELTPRVVMVVARLLFNATQIAVPVCFAVAILHYRLWDVDLLINRSLVYGTVTLLLALVFLGGGFALQTVLGESNARIAFAVSTIGAAFLFNPARKQAQRLIDRRIYGFRFDLNELERAQHMPPVRNPGALTGRRLGSYRVLGVLGRGGMGEVYQGEKDGDMVAIKVFPREFAGSIAKWFERESQALAAIDHPNIVRFRESGECDGLNYLVLDYVEGRDLGEVIRERGGIPLGETRAFVRDCAAALDYAHSLGLVHRDIKPSNIMVRRKADGRTLEAVLMDFGIAKIEDARTALTSTGVVGTIGYMAPEQIMAATTVDRRADIYSLGVTVYEMLTGQLPFKGNPAEVLFAHLQQQPGDPRQLSSSLPATAAVSVLKALEKRPEDRFRTVGEFALALETI